MDNDNMLRYTKQIKLAHFGEQAQSKLSSSHVAIIGLGALGSTVAEQLARSGVGTLTLIDRDYVELSNLQRQQLYTEHDVTAHLPKAIAAADRLLAINSTIQLNPIVAHLNATNIDKLLHDAHLIIDATDNLFVRHLINEYAVSQQKVWIHGAVASTYGRVFTIIPHITPCFKCIYPVSPELNAIDTCDTVGVLNSIVNIIASMQVTEALKWLIEKRDDIASELIEFDVWTHNLFKINLSHAKNDKCPVCSLEQYPLLDHDIKEERSAVLCGRNTVQVFHPQLNSNTYQSYVSHFKQKYSAVQNMYLTKMTVDKYSVSIFPDGRSLIQGCSSTNEATQVLDIICEF